MLRHALPLLALAASLAAAGPAMAQDASADMRCVMVGNAFATSETDPPKKQLAAATALFYLGRVDAKLNPAQQKAMLLAQAKALAGQNLGQIMTNCAQSLQAKQRAMQAMGQELAKAQPQPAPVPPKK